MDKDLMATLAPITPKRPLLPELSPSATLALLCHSLFREGYNDHIAGHITWRQDDDTLLANPWELAWDELTGDDILTLSPEGQVTAGGWNITPAINLHTEIYSRRPDVTVIIHNHSRYGTLWANAGRVPPVYDQTSAQVDGALPLLDEYNAPVNDKGEGARCAELLGKHKWALLANHGVLVVGGSIEQAYLRAATLEWRCRVAYEVELLGGGKPLADDVAAAVGAMIDGNGFPFYWEASARRVIRRHPELFGQSQP